MVRVILVFCSIFLAFARPVRAEEVDDATRGAARKMGYAGVEAFQAGDFQTAHDKLEKAYRVLRAPSLGLWSARTLARLGKLVEASERYLEVTRLELGGGDVAVQKQAQADARTELEALSPRVPSIVVVIRGAEPADVKLSVDGAPMASELIGESRPANPGPHAIVGRTSVEEVKAEVNAVEGKPVTATLVFTKSATAVAPAVAAPPAHDTASSASRGSTLRTLGWISLGVGAAGIVTGTVTGLLAMGKHSTLEDDPRCNGDECLPSAQSDVTSLDTFRTISTVGFIAGGVLAATGITLVLVAPKRSEVGLRVGPGMASLVGRFP